MAYYDLIRIYGWPDNEQEQFQGLGAAALYNANEAQPVSGGDSKTDVDVTTPTTPTTPETPEEELPDALWEAQAVVIQQQSAFVKKIQEDFKKKFDETPTMDEITQTTFIEEFIEWVAGRVVSYFWGPTAGEIAEFAVALSCLAIKLLNALLQESIEICNALVKENDALLTLTKSRDDYILRSQIISQHDNCIANILTSITTTESQLIQSRQLDEMVRRNEIATFEGTNRDMVLLTDIGDPLYTHSMIENID